MKRSKLDRIARSIVEGNIYLTLGTTDGRSPWVSPLYYCRDDKNRFYVISQPGSRHIRNIASHPNVSFAIFDSHAAEGRGNGVQGSARMTECKGRMLGYGLQYYHTDFIPCSEESFTTGDYRLYRISPTSAYILNPEAKTDKRIAITIR